MDMRMFCASEQNIHAARNRLLRRTKTDFMQHIFFVQHELSSRACSNVTSSAAFGGCIGGCFALTACAVVERATVQEAIAFRAVLLEFGNIPTPRACEWNRKRNREWNWKRNWKRNRRRQQQPAAGWRSTAALNVASVSGGSTDS